MYTHTIIRYMCQVEPKRTTREHFDKRNKVSTDISLGAILKKTLYKRISLSGFLVDNFPIGFRNFKCSTLEKTIE